MTSQHPDNNKKTAKTHSDKLARLGTELGKIRFSYKIKETASKNYWECRITNYKKYSEKGMEYYSQVYAMMSTVDKKEARMFLLQVSKFRQLSKSLSDTMNRIKENPTIMDSKDKQQSLWSREIKSQVIKQSDTCLKHEVEMNTAFRKFYDTHLKTL